MGTYQITNCPITGLPAKPVGDPSVDIYEYLVTYNNHKFIFVMYWDLFHNEEFWKLHRDKIMTLLFNGLWFNGEIKTEKVLKFIEENFPRRTPNQKMDDLLEYLHLLIKI